MSMDTEIDDSLYSRQRYVLGDTAMKRMAQASVLLYGVGGLGIEIAKNIVLAGIKSLTIYDDKVATVADLGTQFFLHEEDVDAGLNRAEACYKRIAELNPYVTINTTTISLHDSTDLTYLKDYQCVILTEISLDVQRKVNDFCRKQDPPIKFISGDVFGVFAGCFCDFGNEFDIFDTNGEEPKELFVGNITKGNPAIVTCLENTRHYLQTTDQVTFKEVKGMTALNGKVCSVSVLNPFTFKICDTSGEEFSEYDQGGICVQLKIPEKGHHDCLETQLTKPSLLTPDLNRMNAPHSIHCAFLALQSFYQMNGRLPNTRCSDDAQLLLSKAKELNSSMSMQGELDENLIKKLSLTCKGCFPPLCAILGGFMAQEVLKAITGKFTPLSQWLYLDVTDVILEDAIDDNFHQKNDRYDLLRLCIGEDTLQKLQKIHLFMVGCGAIGCEMLKNFALLGLATEGNGLITITDNDLIEKSNLNRQFLFRPHHIRQPKSTTAANSVLEINPALNIEAHQNKVCPQTEYTIYSDAFFENQDVLINALDNVEARRYMDSRCVSNQRALLESGTMGTKGHVQTIIPHLTESYSNQNDPLDEEIPYCTLKSFPANIEHCIQWARDKFESSFNQKPYLVNKFWSRNESSRSVAEKLMRQDQVEGAYSVSRVLRNAPQNMQQCIYFARCKFQKYFNHKARQLLHAFPLDTKLSDGGMFWQSPKRPPQPLMFDSYNSTHMMFIQSTSRLYADIHGVPWKDEDLTTESIMEQLENVEIPEFRVSHKQIETDETVKKEDVDEMQQTSDEQHLANEFMTQIISNKHLTVIEFEKDDDTNSHIDFITTASNLRAAMYNIENADRLKVKRIAGHIVPAIATTTATISGLVAVELLKVVNKTPLEKYRNCFLNLALPLMLLSEPGAAETMKINDELSLTVWDRWEIEGNKDFTLEMFLTHFKEKTGYNASMIVHGAKMIYVPILPGHKKRLPQSLIKLLKPLPQQKYVDLIVSLESDGDDDDIPGPPLRYHFGL